MKIKNFLRQLPTEVTVTILAVDLLSDIRPMHITCDDAYKIRTDKEFKDLDIIGTSITGINAITIFIDEGDTL